MKFEDISYNFYVAKVIAILIVATGHFFEGIWWIPTTNALFVFAFSSGFFTSIKYSNGFSIKKFWLAKISRLMYSILVIDIFLFSLFLIRQTKGIFTWHTIPSLIGLNGFLGWFNIVNASPFGAGLWFFSLLILFYILYPFFSLINKNQIYAVIFLLLSLITTTVLFYTVHMGYMLWLTAFAFIFGAYTGKYNLKLPPSLSLLCVFASYIIMIYFNLVLSFKTLNYFFILLSSIAIVSYILNKGLPTLIIEKTLLLSGCVIEIYFIHSYMFVKPTENYIFNYLISMLVIITVSYFLSRTTEKLRIVINKNLLN